jgi:SH3-like domain-containing protein
MFIKPSRIILVPVILAALVALSAPAVAAETSDYEVTPCKPIDPTMGYQVFVGDKDPAGTNVRSGPGEEYPVIATLPTDATVLVEITGCSEGWIRIGRVFIWDDPCSTAIPLVGWIHGSLLYPNCRCEWYSEPTGESTVLEEIPPDARFTLVGCRDGWIKVQYGGHEGWLKEDCLMIPEGYFTP